MSHPVLKFMRRIVFTVVEQQLLQKIKTFFQSLLTYNIKLVSVVQPGIRLVTYEVITPINPTFVIQSVLVPECVFSNPGSVLLGNTRL